MLKLNSYNERGGLADCFDPLIYLEMMLGFNVRCLVGLKVYKQSAYTWYLGRCKTFVLVWIESTLYLTLTCNHQMLSRSWKLKIGVCHK
jgi:hypothetical protein